MGYRVRYGSGGERLPFAAFAAAWAGIALACLAIAVYEGQDFNSVYLHYHLYGPYALLHDRLGTDFMAAAQQGYFNPYSNLPLYALVTAGGSDWLITGVLALWHALSLVAIFHIQLLLTPVSSRTGRLALAAGSVLLAALSPVFLGLVGGTFNDILLAPLLLGSLWLTLRPGRSAAGWFTAGALLGAAIGLKYTHAIYAPGALLALLIVARRDRPMRALLYWGAGSAAAFLVTAGPWMWLLAQEFGNPLYPLMNGWFKSPDYPTAAMAPHYRFLPLDWQEWLTRPWWMAMPGSFIYIETDAPDMRFLALFALLLLWPLAALRRALARGAPESLPGGERRAAFFTWLLAAYAAWLSLSGNGRYALVVLLLAGPAIVTLVSVALRRNDLRALLIGGVVAVQAAFAFVVAEPNHRLRAVPLDGVWTELTLPAAAREQRFGYLFINHNANTTFFPWIDPRSGFLSLTGLYVVPKGGAGWARVERFFENYRGALRGVVGRGGEAPPDYAATAEALNTVLAPYGLLAKGEGCFTISGRTGPADAPADSFHMDSCPLELRPELAERWAPESAAVLAAFDRVEASCPLWFQPPGPGITHRKEGWERRYDATDVVLFSKEDELFVARMPYGPFMVPLGKLSAWREAPQPLECVQFPRHFVEGVQIGRAR